MLAGFIPYRGVGLVHEDCIAKMRLLSLVDLGSNDSARIPYALIKDALRVDKLPLFQASLSYIILWSGCDLCFRSMMMRWNCGWWRPLLPNWLTAKWTRWMKLWLWGVCYTLFTWLQRTSMVIHSLFCTKNFLMFMCSRSTERVFGQQQWETLRTRLATWRVSNLFCFSFNIKKISHRLSSFLYQHYLFLGNIQSSH